MYICQSQSPNSSHPPFSPSVSIHLFSTSLSLFLPCEQVHLYHFSKFHIYALIYNIFFSFWLTSLCMTVSRSIYVSTNDPISFLFMASIHRIYVPHLLYPFFCRWAFRLLPWPGYCKQCCSERWGACVFFFDIPQFIYLFIYLFILKFIYFLTSLWEYDCFTMLC